ncbi:MAG: hypothetical protein ACKVRN_00545 [Pyrinomonadaceae bacterium]
MTLDLENTYERLYAYCKEQDFAGHDPFDGLNSVSFQLTPLKHSALARVAWLQIVKRSPVDLRFFLGVKKGVNPKGLALFALAELSRFRATKDSTHEGNAKELIELLLATRIEGRAKHGQQTTAFGYNFDWQSRVFYAPVGTPAIVPTACASQAFVEAFQIFKDEKYLAVAEEICGFVMNGLNRPVETNDEVCFSYTPVDKSIIFNASLLAGESLARIGAITGNEEYLEMASKTVRFVIRRQRTDGAWDYGASESQAWVDNFHTAYILQSLHRISNLIPELESVTNNVIRKGASFWLDNFFLDDGTPKYYDKAVYPIDIHSAAVAIAAMCELKELDERMPPMAEKTAQWTIENMHDPQGYFYYQKQRNRVIRTPFMRWGQAWMAYALARLIESKDGN